MQINDVESLKEILDSITCFVSIEDELIKLFCLVSCAKCETNYPDRLHKDYLKEKIGRIMNGTPLVIDNSAKAMYIGIKLGRVKQRDTTPQEEGEPN